MAYQKKSYIEHIAVRVKDIRWHIQFFEEALGMPVVNWIGNQHKPDQAWLAGGIQLISDTSNLDGRLDHIAIITENLDEAVHEAVIRGGVIFHKGSNWIELPDGLVIELIQQAGNEVDDLLNVKVSYLP